MSAVAIGGNLLLMVQGMLAIPVAVLLIQVVAALLPRRCPEDSPQAFPTIAVVVPAHNEEGGICATLASLAPELNLGNRVVVVADNCDDGTARLASFMGAEVVIRNEPGRRGKGYALDAGIHYLRSNPPEVVIVVDADCTFRPGGLQRIARLSRISGRPVQALYLMRRPLQAGKHAAIAEFAWIVKNLVRPLGFNRLGLPCQLMGTGMAFPWLLADRLHLATGNIVEDLQMGLDCARTGSAPLFCADAQVWSEFPSSDVAARTQRTRWEHGHLATIVTQTPRLLMESILRMEPALFVLALDLCVPPLALLCLLVGGLFASSLVFAALTSWFGPALLALALAGALSLAVGLAWLGFGRESLPFRSLLSVGAYALGKLPLYAGFLSRRQSVWVRTQRGRSDQ